MDESLNCYSVKHRFFLRKQMSEWQ